MNDYEVLGIKESADEKEVKRAYFRLVRQYSPEKDPEKFQQIRQAYENLKEGGGKKGPALKIPEDPFAGKMFQQIVDLYRRHDYESAIETAEEAIGYYGAWEGFLYYLALSQLENGNTGNAVKNFEKLTELSPDSLFFAQKLALSYMERGYGKKAHKAFEKAYGMGCREIDFLNDYAMNCWDRKDYARGMALLMELIKIGSVDRKKNMLPLMNAYAGLFRFCTSFACEQLEEIRQRFYSFLEDAVPYMAEYEDNLEDALCTIVYDLKKGRKFCMEDRKCICERLRRGLGSGKADAMWKNVENSMDRMLISNDDRLSDPWKAWNELLIAQEGEEKIDPSVVRFALLDFKLCILEEWPAIRAEIEVIRDNYPDFYDVIREYVETLGSTANIDYLRSKMKKDYERLGRYMSMGMYEEKYGKTQKQPDPGELWESDHNDYVEPCVRSQPKIGRNDPCPCGSGKKYKKCCGKGI